MKEARLTVTARIGARGSRLAQTTGAFLVAAILVGLVTAPADAQDTDLAFQGVQQALEDARQLVLSEAPVEGTDRAEGFRYFLRRIEHWLQSSGLDDVDTGHPRIYRCPSKVCKLGFDSPDFVYLSVGPIDEQHDYRVFGKRGSVDLITFQMNEGLGGTETMTSDDLIVDANGNWEITLSPNPQPGHWLLTKPGARALLIRQIFSDWDNETEASVQVEVLGSANPPVDVLTPAKCEVGLNRLPTDIFTIPNLFQPLRQTWPENEMDTPAPGGFGFSGAGFPDNHTSAARYDVAPGQALIVEVEATGVRFYDIQLGNIWSESLDYGSRQVSLNAFQAHLDADNKWRYVLAHSDPGVPNWLDISGHEQGGIFMRFLIPDPSDLPTDPVVSLVPIGNVQSLMPAGHPTVSPDQRTAILASREQAINRRINPAGLNLGITQIDHFQCYKAKDLKNPRFVGVSGVSLEDQFGSSTADVKKLDTVCAPVDENGAGIMDESQHLCCYKIKGAKLDPAQKVQTTDQFGTLQVELKKARTLCQPCSKVLLP